MFHGICSVEQSPRSRDPGQQGGSAEKAIRPADWFRIGSRGRTEHNCAGFVPETGNGEKILDLECAPGSSIEPKRKHTGAIFVLFVPKKWHVAAR